MSPTTPIEPERLSLESFLRPGDRVVCGQACAEPLKLTWRLVAQCADRQIAVQVFVGTLFSDTFEQAPPGMQFLSYGAIGRAARIADRGAFDVLPERYSRLPGLFAELWPGKRLRDRCGAQGARGRCRSQPVRSMDPRHPLAG